MTWTELYTLFDGQCKRGHAKILATLEKGIKPPGLTLGKEVDGETLRAADLACQCYAEDRKWPIMVEPAVRWECWKRLHAARDFSKFIACPDTPNAQLAESLAKKIKNRYSDSEMIRWILVDYWWHAGMWADLYQCTTEKD
jgi:hypothetical protein